MRSNFEHGSIIWRPLNETEIIINDFEKLRKQKPKETKTFILHLHST